jgi:hypothetical protein
MTVRREKQRLLMQIPAAVDVEGLGDEPSSVCKLCHVMQKHENGTNTRSSDVDAGF